MKQDNKNSNSSHIVREFLIPGHEYLRSAHPDFELVGRDDDLTDISKTLMRKNAHNLIMTGASGVGTTSLILGLETSKKKPDTPYDISGKTFYWLDTDSLFASNDTKTVQENFYNVLDTMSRTSDSVLVIQNAPEFIEAARNRGCLNFINALMGDLWNNNFQAILECRDNQLSEILGCHPYIRQMFTVRDVTEPEPENLKIIVTAAARQLESFHGIRIAPEAIDAAIKLTEQFHVSQFEQAQPGRTLSLLDAALTSYRHTAHTVLPPAAVKDAGALCGEFDQNAAVTENEWSVLQADIRRIQQERREAEARLYGTDAQEGADDLKRLLAEKETEFKKLNREINSSLTLTAADIYAEFSRISKLSLKAIDSDETSMLLEMEKALSAVIFGQDEPVKGVTAAVRSGRLGLKSPDEPVASFVFLGPSGTGKTALAEHLADHLFQDKAALQRYDMSEFNGDGAVERFIETVTENMRRRPYCVNIFDEMEKADKKIFDLFLQINDKGQLTNSAGLVASFANSINIVTSNIGQDYFYDEKLSFEEASAKAKDALSDTEKSGYRNEVLNRFTGVYCFKTLEAEQLLMVAKKQMQSLARRVEEKGLGFEMPRDDDLTVLCRDHYVRRKGARSIQKYIRENVAGDIALLILQNSNVEGAISIRYDREEKKISSVFNAAGSKRKEALRHKSTPKRWKPH
ncbi:MAG: ATP-dependent Clp protease ATP-binding subunit [Micavibrio sp.]|nr:MAG: ATP-dependent Clp protease ATP-binding subunit [Micavibrio sp.]